VQILNEKDGSVHGFKVTDETTIRCEEGFLHRNTVMHPSALVPALTVEVEGIGTPQDMPEANVCCWVGGRLHSPRRRQWLSELSAGWNPSRRNPRMDLNSFSGAGDVGEGGSGIPEGRPTWSAG
jgi:hypothetical protein